MNQFTETWHTFRRKPMGILGALMLLSVVFVAIFAPMLAPYDPDIRIDVDPGDLLAPPDSEYLLGRDDAGQDVLSQLIYGARVSLTVGFVASFMSMFIGTTVGLVAGYYGGKIGNALMRVVDFLMVIPTLPLMLVFISMWGRGLWKIILVIGLLGWTYTARLVRSQVVSVKERKFVERARAIGASNLRIILRHVFPQVLPIILAMAVLDISGAIIAESSLSFLGLGDPTLVSWGMMLNFAFERAISRMAWWFLLPPGFAIVWVSLGLVMLGSTLEDIVNPRLKTHHLFDARSMVALFTRVQPREEPKIEKEILEVRNLSINYLINNDTALRAVEDLSFSLKRGGTLGLVGESGCGKTTAMLGLLRLLPAEGRIVSGEVLYQGEDLLRKPERDMRKYRWNKISIVFQGAMNALNPVRKVGDQIAETIMLHGVAPNRQVADLRVRELLELVGITPAMAKQYPHQYSGGMRQRAMIAMALTSSPDILIADEPTTALDVMIQAQILDLLQDLQRKLDLSIIMVTHNLGVVAEICDEVLVMYGGRTAEYASVDSIFNEPEHPYTQRLMQAFPDIDKPTSTLASIPGFPPPLNALPPGCRFEPRCHCKRDICKVESPLLVPIKSGHYVACHRFREIS
jgi:oligopeptide/dipeptide ABC transporter ATP-binding protein